ncbi:hypothetical protein ACS0PU_003241 [Formica fusca]
MRTCVYLCASAPLRGGLKSFTFLLHWLESSRFEPASFHSSLFIANHRSFYYSPYIRITSVDGAFNRKRAPKKRSPLE